MIDIKKQSNETEEQFLWRIGQLIDSGQIENWKSVTDKINRELGIDETEYRGESAFRKKYQAAKKFYDNCFSKMENEEYQKKLEVMNRELAKSTVRYRDERNAWNKQNYIAARAEQKLDYLEEQLLNQGRTNFEVHDLPNIDGTTDLLVVLSDLHIGSAFSSTFGEYNSDIAKNRLEKYLNEVIRIGKLHNTSKVHVACIGDLISGNIHKTIQITNRENVIEQIKLASEYISSFCYELTKIFNYVYLYEIPGNHSRIDKKEEALKDERLDTLVSWSVCQSLKHIENFHSMIHRKLDTTIGEACIRNRNYLLLHGDHDSMTKQGIADLSLMLGWVPEYVIMGHKHVPAMNEFNGVRVYQSGSLSGSGDDYTIERRMAGKASQLVLVCNDNGVECSYNVMLS